jgi:transposase
MWRTLFAIEATAREQNMNAAQRLALRIEKSQPIINEMKAWLNKNMTEVTPASLMGKAIAYTLNRWNELTLFLKNGRIELSNNLIENSIRPFVLGRKNFLFCQSEESATALGSAYTILGTLIDER